MYIVTSTTASGADDETSSAEDSRKFSGWQNDSIGEIFTN